MNDPSMRAQLLQAVRQWDGFLALGFGSGLVPKAPGTFGTLAAVPLALALKQLPLGAQLVLITFAFMLGVWVCDRVGKRLGAADHGAMVWDEFVGYWVAVLLIPVTFGWLLTAFVLFRLLDILKPWPIRALERRSSGGFGVMVDDLLAGILTMLLLMLLGQWF
ncbi:MAG: phosphatidylglycerophosphatase A [Xanthomonadales bacterium]|nr:phosphatidylglycerophosphatase A [Xanthomonadales bacterium]